VVDHRHAQEVVSPVVGVGVEALAGQEQAAEARDVMTAQMLAGRVLLLDGPERGGRGEERLHPVL
jgi:hypothetical protein